MIKELDRIEQIITGLLLFARPQSGRPSACFSSLEDRSTPRTMSRPCALTWASEYGTTGSINAMRMIASAAPEAIAGSRRTIDGRCPRPSIQSVVLNAINVRRRRHCHASSSRRTGTATQSTAG